jgi:hypothetical protein
MRGQRLTGQQWRVKAHRHQAWDASWRADMAALEARIEGVDDILTLHEIITRAGAIEKRIARLKRIMARHLERTPDAAAGRDIFLEQMT